MGNNFGMIYWGCMVVVLSLIFMSLMGSYPSALLLSVMLMPGILFVKFFSGGISFRDRRKGITATVYLTLIALLIEYLAVALVYWFLHRFDFPDNGGILTNPVFICFLLGSLLAIESWLRSRLYGGESGGAEEFITFISGRKKISLDTNAVTHIESRDTEVLVWTSDGVSHQTRMKISQWDTVLDSRFIRVHRSFIVNRKHITGFDSRTVRLGERTIEISRKYRDEVLSQLR
ncbi:MAG: LytTR family transcriptional regulator [Rikenellaceae bacterium]|nr:LytTR family transcriptional regulator [Rikenellaceae bacterium]